MVGGLDRITLDIPPFVMAAERDEIVGLNLVGLKRRGFSREVVTELKECFREVFFDGGNVRHRAQELLARRWQSAEARRFLEFFAGGRRGIARARRGGRGVLSRNESIERRTDPAWLRRNRKGIGWV
jgi:UDP-N-acetylglucosamine acyltransferase